MSEDDLGQTTQARDRLNGRRHVRNACGMNDAKAAQGRAQCRKKMDSENKPEARILPPPLTPSPRSVWTCIRRYKRLRGRRMGAGEAILSCEPA
jgi:hypothetical protein